MAVTKIKSIKGTLKKAIAYLCNKDKTDGKLLISSFGCSPETADIEFEYTRRSARDHGEILARHLIQSFAPDETTPEQAHKIGVELAEKLLGGRYEYVLSTHIDRGHIHNHLLFNAVDFVDHRRYHMNKNGYKHIRKISDELCKSNGLSVIESSSSKGKSYKEYTAEKSGMSYKAKLRIVIDSVIPKCSDFNDFLRRMELAGYEIRHGKYISFRAKAQERFTRCKTLGEDYTEESISERIAGKRQKSLHTGSAQKSLGLIVDIENLINSQRSSGSVYWTKIQNLKQAAKTVNYLTENNISSYDQLTLRYADIDTEFENTKDILKSLERKITELTLTVKNISVYKSTKAVYDRYCTLKNKSQFYSHHESEIILHKASVKALNISLDNHVKLPEINQLRAEINAMTSEKNRLYEQYEAVKKQASELGLIKSNVDSILNISVRKQKEKVEELI